MGRLQHNSRYFQPALKKSKSREITRRGDCWWSRKAFSQRYLPSDNSTKAAVKQEKGKSAIYVANKNNEELLFDKNVAWEARFSKTISCDRLVEPGRLYLGHFELFWGPKKLVNDLKIDLGKTS